MAAVASSDVIVGLSASPAVLKRIAASTAERPVAVSASQLLSGSATVLLVEGAGAAGDELRLDVVEADLVAHRDQIDVVAHWLEEEPEPLNVGGGCRDVSSRVPDAMARLGAAWIADNIVAME